MNRMLLNSIVYGLLAICSVATAQPPRTPTIADTIRANVYADAVPASPRRGVRIAVTQNDRIHSKVEPGNLK